MVLARMSNVQIFGQISDQNALFLMERSGLGWIIGMTDARVVAFFLLGHFQRWSRGHKARGQAQGQGHKKIRGQGQGQPFRGQTLSRPRTGMLEAKAKDQGHKRKCSPKKKKKKVFTKIFQAVSKTKNKKRRSSQKFFKRSPQKKRFLKNFSSAPQNFNNSKNSAVLEPRTGQFSRT